MYFSLYRYSSEITLTTLTNNIRNKKIFILKSKGKKKREGIIRPGVLWKVMPGRSPPAGIVKYASTETR